MLRKLFCCLSLLLIVNVSFADSPDLLQVFSDAVRFDPTYQGQVAVFHATEQDVPETRSVLLPQLDLSAAIDRERDSTSRNGTSYLTTNNFGLSLNQTIFNFNQFKLFSRAKYAVRAAAYTLGSQQQDLMIRTATAYYDVLSANDLLNYTAQQKRFIGRQLDATKIRFKHGEETITDLQQAQGAYDLISAQYTSAQLALYNALQVLSEITSKQYTSVASLKSSFPLITPKPNRLSSWLATLTQRNLNLIADRYSIAAAHENIKAQQGNYLPTLAATVSYDNGRTPTTNTANRTITQSGDNASAGVNFDWPVYQGGLTNSQVARARAQLNESDATLRNTYLTARSETRQAFQGIIAGKTSILLDRAAISANTKSLNNAEEGYRAGTTTITEVLQIQSQLFSSQREYVQDLYTYLLDILRLKQASGILSVKSLAIQNSWLK